MADLPVNGFPARAPVLTDVIGIQDSAGSTATAKSTFQEVVDLTIASAGFTQDSVLFAGASGEITENNVDFTWDNATTTMKFGGNHTINGAVTDCVLTGNLNTVQVENATIVHGQNNIAQDGNRNFIQGSSNQLDTCNDSAAIASTSVDLTSTSNSGSIGSTTCTNNGFDNSVFIGASSANCDANYGIIMGEGSAQKSGHDNILIWGDGQVGAFDSVASDAWHIRAQGGAYLTDGSLISADNETILTLESTTKYVKLTGGTTAERNAITPSERALFYDKTLGEYFYGNGSVWAPMSGGSGTTGTVTTSWSGPFAAPVSGDIDYIIENGFVTLQLPTVQDTATSSAAISATALLPASIRPAVSQQPVILVGDNGSDALGQVFINISGQVTVYADIAGNDFSGSGVTGFGSTGTISYKV